jgi:hypothetical protein
MSEPTNKKPDSLQWKLLLESDEAASRLEAIRLMASLPESSEEIVRHLEQTALWDVDENVRQAAEDTLLAYPHQPVYRSLVGRDGTARQFMLYELAKLETVGLIKGRAARLIKARYALTPVLNPALISKAESSTPLTTASSSSESAASKPTPPIKQPIPSLTQILLSETTIKIALYLGAFFVVAAAFILAALVEVSRLPVLSVTTLLFVGASFGLSRRLPLASFVLFCVALLLIPIDGQVLLPVIKLEGASVILFYWGGIWLLTLLVSAGGLFFYRSRLLSLAAFGVGLVSLYYFGQGFKLDFETQLLLFGLWNLASLCMAYGLKVGFGESFFWPIFITIGIIEPLILGISFSDWAYPQFQSLFDIYKTYEAPFSGTNLPWGWISLLWLTGSGFYLVSDILTRRLNRSEWWNGMLVVLSLLPVPILFLNQLKLAPPVSLSIIWVWAILLGAAHERIRRARFNNAKWYAAFFLAGFVFYSCLVPTSFASYENYSGVTLSLAGSAIAAVVFSRLKLRWHINCAAILFATAAYFSMFQIPQIEPFRDSLLTGEIVMLPAFLLLTLDWVGRLRGWSKQIWIPALAAGTIYFLLDFILILFAVGSLPEKVTRPELRLLILLCMHALFTGFFARSFKLHFNSIPWSFSLLEGYLAIFFLMSIPEVDAMHLFRPAVFSVPTLVLLGTEWLLRWRGKALSWRIPALVMGISAALYSFTILFDFQPEQTWMVVLILAGFALFWGMEARSLKEVLWLPWFLSLSCAYAAYLVFWTIPAVKAFNLDVLWIRLLPALILLGLEWLLRKRQLAFSWRLVPLALSVVAVLANIFPILELRAQETWMVATVLGVYALFFTLDAIWIKNRLAWIPWSFALISLYSAYLYFWQIPVVNNWHTSMLIINMPPILAFLGLEWLLRWRGKGKEWSWPALTAGCITLAVNIISMINIPSYQSNLVMINCTVNALFLGVYSFSGIQAGFIYWTMALLFASTAYWRVFDQGWRPFLYWKDELKLLPLGLIFLGLDLELRKRKFKKDWWMPPLMMGVTTMAIDLILSAASGMDPHPGSEPAWIFAAWGMFLTLHMWRDSRPWVGYAATSSLAITLSFALKFMNSKEWVLALALLAALFYLVGFILYRKVNTWRYGRVYIWSALILAGLVSISAPIEYHPSAVAGVALAALLFTLEGLRRRSVWWGFPACVLYFMSYSLALSLLKINEPQYYSIGAALLGIIMHYLLLRTANTWAAFITGLLAQLILFGTSYIQMVQSLDLKFFLMLFFQSLVLLVYGLIVRSRTLVLVPIFFAILGVVTVTFTILKGLPTALMIGCTGLLLLALGITGLLLRERLVKWVENFKLRLENW